MPSADSTPYSFEALVQAYLDCRAAKRNTASALAFEERLEANLLALHDELCSGLYRPGRSICFVITRPKPREVWAADFRDRIVHHLLYNAVAPRIEAGFVHTSCACIKGRGTLYAAEQLEHMVRSITQNWQRPAWYLKIDLANFFVAIDKRVLQAQLHRCISAPWWRGLADTILMHDPRTNYELRDQCQAAGVPFLFKQWGEFLPAGANEADPTVADVPDSRLFWSDGEKWDRFDGQRAGVDLVARVGKKAAGRLLDGRTVG